MSGAGGYNPDLKPETSKSYSLGAIFSPSSNFDMLVDIYRIRKEGEIALGTSFDALKNEDKTPGNIVRDPNPANFVTDASGKPVPGTGILLSVKTPWQNQGAIEVQGADFEFRLRNNLGERGRLATTLRSTYTRSYLISESVGAIENNLAGARAGIYDWNLNAGIDNPKWKSTLSTSWTLGDHSVNASIRYVGPISLLRVKEGEETYAQPFCYYGTAKPTDAKPNRNTTIPLYEAAYPSCSVNSWTTVGLGYTYTGFKNLSLNLNIQNLLDTKAPYDPAQPLAGYSAGLANNTGRYFNVSARYAF